MLAYRARIAKPDVSFQSWAELAIMGQICPKLVILGFNYAYWTFTCVLSAYSTIVGTVSPKYSKLAHGNRGSRNCWYCYTIGQT